jgi:soluble lytic murein transglycosylase-like protein
MTRRIATLLGSTVASCASPAAAACALILACAGPASAELVYFKTGGTMSVSSHRADGDRVVLQLRGGGEMTVGTELVEAIGADEVPYPEPPRLPEDRAVDASVLQPAGRLPLPPGHVDRLIQQIASAHGVDAALVRAVVAVESGFEARARSPKGAVGLMQVLPSTGRQYGIADLYDPGANLEAGVRHLKGLLDRFPLSLALAAYNAGEAAVRQFRGVPPYPETRAYVARVRALLTH